MFSNNHRIINDPLNWYWFQSEFSDEEITKIEELVKYVPRHTAGVTKDNSEDFSIRKSTVRWIPRNDETKWIYDKLALLADVANENLWHFDMYGAKEQVQYTEYYDDGGHYEFHLDVGAGDPLNQRKISLTVQLSDPDTYDGGDFEIMRGMHPEKLPRKKGAVILFPSYILHRVTPVTRGVRKSLVFWLGGASYK